MRTYNTCTTEQLISNQKKCSTGESDDEWRLVVANIEISSEACAAKRRRLAVGVAGRIQTV